MSIWVLTVNSQTFKLENITNEIFGERQEDTKDVGESQTIFNSWNEG